MYCDASADWPSGKLLLPGLIEPIERLANSVLSRSEPVVQMQGAVLSDPQECCGSHPGAWLFGIAAVIPKRAVINVSLDGVVSRLGRTNRLGYLPLRAKQLLRLSFT